VNQAQQVDTILIFTDAATSAKTMVSVGAFLCLDQKDIDQYSKSITPDLSAKLADAIIYKEYKSKKSTWSEIKTVIDALHAVLKKSGPDLKIEIYTDCKSLCDLMNRRKEKLEKSNFMTRAGKVHQNADLYKEFFAIAAKFQIKTFKIKGHDTTAHRLTLHEKIFAILDRLSRKKLRSLLNKRAGECN
jgi:ribonuclease HI